MKTIQKIFLLTVTASLLFSCSSDYSDDPVSGIDLKAKKVTPQVFVVTPSGGDDTPAISQAFDDAKTAGPGSVVQLLAGEYYLGLMEVRDFCGVFKGAGKGMTIINVMNDLDVLSLWNKGLGGDLVKFVGGDVQVRDFTIRTPEGRLSVSGPANGIIRCLFNFSACNADYKPGNTDRSINVVIDNVSCKGQLLEGGVGYTRGYSCYFAIRAGWDQPWGTDIPREKIGFKITNSEFDTFCYGLVLEAMKDGIIIVGENGKGNTFSEIDQAAGVWECRNTQASIQGNTFNIGEFRYGMDLDDYPYYSILRNEPSEKATIFNIQNNIFNMVHSEYAMLLRNRRTYTHPAEPAAIYQVKNNLFNMTDGYEWGILSYFTKDAVIRNNKFSGHGDLALYLVNYSRNGLVLGNNFSAAGLETGVAYLTASTRDWTFVGGNIADQVINLGTNNIFTGFSVNNSEAPFGQTIVDNLKETKEALRELKNH